MKIIVIDKYNTNKIWKYIFLSKCLIINKICVLPVAINLSPVHFRKATISDALLSLLIIFSLKSNLFYFWRENISLSHWEMKWNAVSYTFYSHPIIMKWIIYPLTKLITKLILLIEMERSRGEGYCSIKRWTCLH